MKKYGIKEIFATLQGEGAQAGTAAVFLRFAGCNLGYRVCPWCDTDWEHAAYRLTAQEVVNVLRDVEAKDFLEHRDGRLVVLTGGEPSLQVDANLAASLRNAGYRLAMETNGSHEIDRTLIDWLTVSPKQTDFVQKSGDELKIVFTGRTAPGIAPDVAAVRHLGGGTAFRHYFLQPVDVPDCGGPNLAETVAAVMELGDPWRLSVQTHKVAGIP